MITETLESVQVTSGANHSGLYLERLYSHYIVSYIVESSDRPTGP